MTGTLKEKEKQEATAAEGEEGEKKPLTKSAVRKERKKAREARVKGEASAVAACDATEEDGGAPTCLSPPQDFVDVSKAPDGRRHFHAGSFVVFPLTPRVPAYVVPMFCEREPQLYKTFPLNGASSVVAQC